MIDALALQQAPESFRAQADVFSEIFFVFLLLGTIVGVVVVTYTLLHAYKYRDTGEEKDSFDAPELGELPTGQSGGKSKKLFLSFGLSAIVVISLVVYSYGLLLYVEQGPSEEIDADEELEVQVTGYQFGWEFEYPNGYTTNGELRVPQGENKVIRLQVTSRDVWHNFGVSELRVKSDAIPGETSNTWFVPEETGTYEIECYELCGVGHSQMVADLIIMEEDAFQDWYEGTEPSTDRAAEEGDA